MHMLIDSSPNLLSLYAAGQFGTTRIQLLDEYVSRYVDDATVVGANACFGFMKLKLKLKRIYY